MAFDAIKPPNAVTIGQLVEQGMAMETHCHKCADFVIRDPDKLGPEAESSRVVRPGFRLRRAAPRALEAAAERPAAMSVRRGGVRIMVGGERFELPTLSV